MTDPSCSQTTGLTTVKTSGPLKLARGFNMMGVKIPEEFFRGNR